MHAARSEAEHDVAGSDFSARQSSVAFDSANAKACEVEMSVSIHARHLRRFATNQRASGLTATRGNAFDDLGRSTDIEAAGGEIIQKKQRLGALDNQIVGAHGDQIDTDSVKNLGLDGDQQLCAHAVCRGDKYGVLISRGPGIEKTAESAQTAHHTRARRSGCAWLDRIDKSVPGVDIDPGVAVGQAISFCLVVRHRGSVFPDFACFAPSWRGTLARPEPSVQPESASLDDV